MNPAPPVTSTVGIERGLYKSLQLNCLRLQELLETEGPELAPVSRLLVAAKRSERVERRAVDLHLSRAKPPRHALCALRIARPHAAGEAVHGVVRHAHGVVLVVVRHDREHRAEDLL